VPDIYILNILYYEKENNEFRIACHNSWHNMQQLRRKAQCACTTATTTCTGCTATIMKKPSTTS